MPQTADEFGRELRVRLLDVQAVLRMLRFQALVHAPTIAQRLRIVRALDDVGMEIGELIASCGEDAVELPLRNGEH